MLALLKCDKDMVRGHAIKMLGESLQYCLKECKYQKDQIILFKLLEARIFDKSINCRKFAF